MLSSASGFLRLFQMTRPHTIEEVLAFTVVAFTAVAFTVAFALEWR